MRRTWIILAILVVLTVAVSLSPAAQRPKSPPPEKVDLGAFTREIMCLRMEGDRTNLAMWFPFEFFVVSAMSDVTPREAAEKDLAFLKPYLVVFVESGTDQPDGTTIYATEQEVHARAVLRLADGTEAGPLQKVPPKVAVSVAAMKAALGKENSMYILVFPNEGKNGKPIIDSTRRDRLTLALKGATKADDVVFSWRTPFDAATPAEPCAKCHEPVSSKWSFCPWCGNKLPPLPGAK